MRIVNLKVQNYRGLRDVEIPMSRFVCLIGENNSGKSSVLQTLSLFFSGSSLSGMNFFDESKEIRIELTFSDISEEDLSRLVEEHRTRIQEIIRNNTLTLARVYGTDGKATLRYRKLMPKDPRFSIGNIESLLARQRAGPAFVERVTTVFPELSGRLTTTMNQGDVQQQIDTLADSVPDSEKAWVDSPLPTGIDKSISAMLPDLIYIPAVKDLADDTKTKEGTPFGRVLGILLKAIEPSLSEEKELFEKLESKLNRMILPDGTVRDNRLPEVKEIEKTVERYVRESFSNVTVNIKIPPPELKTVLSSAQIYANDGVEGLIDSKGDGLRRATVFAILRSYVDLCGREDLASDSTGVGENRYLLLFEEPELYLYPQAQQILFDALSVFSRRNCVVVTTHSPLFFGPDGTATFVKLSKIYDTTAALKPFARVHPVDLSDMGAKDQFQIICYENNNAAFFADTVVLVEGDSDYLVLPHVAKTVNTEWNCANTSVQFARINGKTSIKRYKEFFRRFNTRVAVIADLDIIISDFAQLDPDENLKKIQSTLIQRIDEVLLAGDPDKQPSSKEVRDLQEKGKLRALWGRVKKAHEDYKAARVSSEEFVAIGDEFIAYERKNDRLEVLKHVQEPDIAGLKSSLLAELQKGDIFVLEKGGIEDYYPEGIHGADKPSRAQSFCSQVLTREGALSLCGEILTSGGQRRKEFELIFETIFAKGQPPVNK